MENKKNLRRISVVVTSQTLYHLKSMAAMTGWGEKDLGRVIDKLVRTHQATDDCVHARPMKRFNDPHTGRKYTTCSACDEKIGPQDAWCKHCGAKLDLEG